MGCVAALLVFYLCFTFSGLLQGETLEVVYIPVRNPRNNPEAVETTLPRNPYHPLVRFRTVEVRPAYFYVLEKSPGNTDVKLTTRELADLLSSVYEEEYHEPPQKENNNVIRFGLIR
ncbi:uncharacterized protein LOC129004494 [Macrosteles quadrilineatus]|uniref:uncharacterized protein LOC129004494 n=1 Tax=Macrosteles quadrilineatus TaxID=74068 RepID=UPI0023E14E1F|nr:uncharacterized protein LOC129004494 [Macrosteles quadrilineatus]